MEFCLRLKEYNNVIYNILLRFSHRNLAHQTKRNDKRTEIVEGIARIYFFGISIPINLVQTIRGKVQDWKFVKKNRENFKKVIDVIWNLNCLHFFQLLSSARFHVKYYWWNFGCERIFFSGINSYKFRTKHERQNSGLKVWEQNRENFKK